jgi:protein-arginine kinase activator protein McsA
MGKQNARPSTWDGVEMACLKCRETFRSTGKFNRVCPDCNKQNAHEPDRIFVWSNRDGLALRQRMAMVSGR